MEFFLFKNIRQPTKKLKMLMSNQTRGRPIAAVQRYLTLTPRGALILAWFGLKQHVPHAIQLRLFYTIGSNTQVIIQY